MTEIPMPDEFVGKHVAKVKAANSDEELRAAVNEIYAAGFADGWNDNESAQSMHNWTVGLHAQQIPVEQLPHSAHLVSRRTIRDYHRGEKLGAIPNYSIIVAGLACGCLE